MWTASFNLCNVITGSGIIGLPYATRQCGLAVAVPLLIAMAACTLYSLQLLVTAAHRLHRKRALDMEDVLQAAFGRVGYYVGLAAVFCLDLGVMVALLIVIGDTVPPVLSYYLQHTWVAHLTGRTPVLILTSLLFILPPSTFHSLDSLSFISLTSVASVVLLTSLVIVRSFSPASHSTLPSSASVEWVGPRPLQGFGSMAFVFVCHDVALQLYQGVRVRSPVVWGRVTRVSVGAAMLPVLVLSVVGYSAFVDFTASNVLHNFTLADHWMNAARLILAASMAMTYPANLFMCRHVLTQLIGEHTGGGKGAEATHWLLTVVLFSFTVAIALWVDDLGHVQSVVGSVCAVSLAFLIPSACAIRVAQLKDHRPLLSAANAGAWAVAVVGAVVITLAITTQLTEVLVPSTPMPIPKQAYS